MKSLMTGLFAAILVSAPQASALNLDVVASLPIIRNVNVVISTPSPFTPVQPTGHIEFEHESCAAASFEASTEQIGDVLVIAIVDTAGMDCAGPLVSREYSVQYSSDASILQKITILNPQYGQRF